MVEMSTSPNELSSAVAFDRRRRAHRVQNVVVRNRRRQLAHARLKRSEFIFFRKTIAVYVFPEYASDIYREFRQQKMAEHFGVGIKISAHVLEFDNFKSHRLVRIAIHKLGRPIIVARLSAQRPNEKAHGERLGRN